MPRKGRRPVATEAQVGEVRRLAADGVSRREIATRVFGDARYHGRVDRILRRVNVPQHHALAGAQLPAPAGTSATLRWLRNLLERHRERLASEELPPLKEIKLLMEIERRLEAAEMVERANALTREGDV